MSELVFSMELQFKTIKSFKNSVEQLELKNYKEQLNSWDANMRKFREARNALFEGIFKSSEVNTTKGRLAMMNFFKATSDLMVDGMVLKTRNVPEAFRQDIKSMHEALEKVEPKLKDANRTFVSEAKSIKDTYAIWTVLSPLQDVAKEAALTFMPVTGELKIVGGAVKLLKTLKGTNFALKATSTAVNAEKAAVAASKAENLSELVKMRNLLVTKPVLTEAEKLACAEGFTKNMCELYGIPPGSAIYNKMYLAAGATIKQGSQYLLKHINSLVNIPKTSYKMESLVIKHGNETIEMSGKAVRDVMRQVKSLDEFPKIIDALAGAPGGVMGVTYSGNTTRRMIKYGDYVIKVSKQGDYLKGVPLGTPWTIDGIETVERLGSKAAAEITKLY